MDFDLPDGWRMAELNQLFDFVAPFTNKVEMLFRTMFTTVSVPLNDDDLCVIERVHFTIDGYQYYCDLITPCRTALEASGNPSVIDHNYITGLKLVKRNNIRLVLSDESGNEVYNKILIFTARQREIKMLTYGYYCESVKGIEGRLENLIPFD